MVFINYSTKEISVKIVYYGPGLSGKTTNLHYIYKKTDKTFRGELVSLDTDTERTLFFDLLPMEVGKIRGFNTKIQLYTVPGQVHYNSTRKLVLKGVDGIVFVADSQKPILEANIGNYKNMLENLDSNHINIDKIPLVFQYNKRDLNNILPVDDLNKILNPSKRPFFEAIAINGKGVLETLREITRLTLHSVKEEVFGEPISDSMKGKNIVGREEIKEEKQPQEQKPEEKQEKIKQAEKEIDIEDKETIEIDMSAEGGESAQQIEKEKEMETVLKEGEEIEDIEPIEVLDESIEEKESDVKDKERDFVKDEKQKEIKEEKEKKDKTKKEEPLSDGEEKKLIEKNLSMKISSEKIIDSSHIYIQFTNQYGDLIKKWKISKEKIKDGAILSLKVDIDIK